MVVSTLLDPETRKRPGRTEATLRSNVGTDASATIAQPAHRIAARRPWAYSDLARPLQPGAGTAARRRDYRKRSLRPQRRPQGPHAATTLRRPVSRRGLSSSARRAENRQVVARPQHQHRRGSRWQGARQDRVLEEEGLTSESSQGVRVHPALVEASAAGDVREVADGVAYSRWGDD